MPTPLPYAPGHPAPDRTFALLQVTIGFLICVVGAYQLGCVYAAGSDAEGPGAGLVALALAPFVYGGWAMVLGGLLASVGGASRPESGLRPPVVLASAGGCAVAVMVLFYAATSASMKAEKSAEDAKSRRSNVGASSSEFNGWTPRGSGRVPTSESTSPGSGYENVPDRSSPAMPSGGYDSSTGGYGGTTG